MAPTRPRLPNYSPRYLRLDRAPVGASAMEWLFSKPVTAITLAATFYASATLVGKDENPVRGAVLPFTVAALALTVGRYAERKLYNDQMGHLAQRYIIDTIPPRGPMTAVSAFDQTTYHTRNILSCGMRVIGTAGFNGLNYVLNGSDSLMIILPATAVLASDIALDVIAGGNIRKGKWALARNFSGPQ